MSQVLTPTTTPTRAQRLRRTGSGAWSVVGIGLVVVALGWTLWTLRLIVLPVLVAGLLASGLAPVLRWITRGGLPRGIATMLTMLGFAAVLTAFGFVIVPGMVDQLGDVGDALNEAADRLERWVERERPFGISGADVTTAREQITASSAIDSLGISARTGARAIGALVTSVLVVAVTTFFLLRDGPRFHEAIVARTPARSRPRVDAALHGVVESLRGFLAGAAVLGLVEGTIIALALWLTGAELAVVVGALTLILAFVPFIGAIVAGVIAVGVALVSGGTTSAIIVAIVVLVVQQFDNELLAPVIYGRLLRLHPLTVILGTAIGIEAAGVIGAFATVPILAGASGAWRAVAETRSQESPDQDGELIIAHSPAHGA